ncbi:MAG TPA: hypothetical protein VGD58_31550 [Herpetosiphonaceae bacterium]
MNQTTTWQDIATSVQRAIGEHLDLIPEDGLVQRSDMLLTRLPRHSGSQPISTALFLRRYHMALHQELCQGVQPRIISATVEDELRDLTRAVMLTIGSSEGVSVEAAVGLALVLYKRGVTRFCALSTVPISTA